MSDAFLIITKLTMFPAELANYIRELPALGITGVLWAAFQGGVDAANPISGAGLQGIWVMFLIVVEFFSRRTAGIAEWIVQKPLLLRWAWYYTLAFAVLLSWPAAVSQFIYFAF
jgi:hypothetical protein